MSTRTENVVVWKWSERLGVWLQVNFEPGLTRREAKDWVKEFRKYWGLRARFCIRRSR